MATTTKRAKVGPRASVVIGTVKKTIGGKSKTVKLVSYMAKSTADFFGFKTEAVKSTATKSAGGKTVAPRLIRGSIGAGSIKVPAGKTSAAKGGVQKFKQIPIPSGATNVQIEAFLKTATKNKPTSFVSRDGRTYAVSGTK
ncbi:hypothetical protein Syn7502_00830 [Synechococcus sp. PCC 7502]|uniref:hypothetical protein n=1 Tax=Synechococcus sp. PCC 7502 TaxID=1173263 RepID=UPI00029F99B0|nr:hypothetical protein [Synechococcus sp. PCC 7502]AFY72962.1 hypothetical protein Syn7502_00830 [Synechococcus sp. PCC 7502]